MYSPDAEVMTLRYSDVSGDSPRIFCLRSPELVDSTGDYPPSVRRMLRPTREYISIYPPETKGIKHDYIPMNRRIQVEWCKNIPLISDGC
jgi:hypothetical protein